MAKFKIVTPAGASFTVAGGGYELEMEALDGLDAEIVEVPADSEDAFIAAAKDADAIYAKASRSPRRSSTASNAASSSRWAASAWTASTSRPRPRAAFPVTNFPDTFIEEVADHAMTLLLGGFRRLVEQDRMVREGRWREGRPALLQDPAADGADARLRRLRPCRPRRRDARAAVRAAHDRVRSVHRGTGHAALRRRAGDADGRAAELRFRLDARAGDARGAGHAQGEAFPADEEDRAVHQHRPRTRRWRKPG